MRHSFLASLGVISVGDDNRAAGRPRRGSDSGRQRTNNHIRSDQTTMRLAPRTVDGQPDLQGVWGYATMTPPERRKSLRGKSC